MSLNLEYKETLNYLEKQTDLPIRLKNQKIKLEEYFNFVTRLKSISIEQIKNYIKEICWIGNNNFCNFITDYFQHSKFCKNIFEQAITDVNFFRDNIVENIANDCILYLEKMEYLFSKNEKLTIKNNIIGLIGELFNIYYLTNICAYRTETGILKRFKSVIPFKSFMQKQDLGIDLICLDENDEICVFQVKFYSTWSSKQHKIELKEHCSMIFNEMHNYFYISNDDLKGHIFFNFLGNKETDISIPLKNSPYINYISFIDKKRYYADTQGNTTLYKDFWIFLNSL